MWYAIQVIHGREDAMARLICKVVPAEILSECFSPTFETETKVKGTWVPVRRLMLPGYLIAVTDDPRGVTDCLNQLPEFCRVLKQGGAFVPLGKDEVSLIDNFTKTGARCVPMSTAIKDGDRVVVTEGPLVGHEGLISNIDRHKSIAYLEINICGRLTKARIGLSVVTAYAASSANNQNANEPKENRIYV